MHELQLSGPMSSELDTKSEETGVEKARYCKHCCNYMPIEDFVGTDALKPNICNRHIEVAQSTTRWCKMCDKFICVSLFRKKFQDFTCKKHMYDKLGRKAMAKQRNNPDNVGYISIRNICYVDMKTFKQSSICLKRKEIESLTGSISKHELLNFAVVPVNPSEIISIHNAVVVSRKVRVEMLKFFKNNDQKMYEEIAKRHKAQVSA